VHRGFGIAHYQVRKSLPYLIRPLLLRQPPFEPTPPPAPEYNTNVKVFAHRGAWRDGGPDGTSYPENSRAAIKAAYDLGVNIIETDLQYSKDGKIVINHDASFKGYNIASTNYVSSSTEDGLDKLALSNGESLPLLEDLLDIMDASSNDTTKLFLEIKNTKAIDPAIEMVFSRGLEDRCGWVSTSDATLGTIRSKYTGRGKKAYTNLTVWNAPDFSKISSSTTQSMSMSTSISISVMSDAVSRGFDVNCFMVDTEESMRIYMQTNVPTIATNYSRRLINLKKSLK